MELALPIGVVREWEPSDAASLAQHANDRRIWRNLRDRIGVEASRHRSCRQ